MFGARMICVALLTTGLLGATASNAMAVAEPEFTVETSMTGTSGKGKLNLTGASLKWEKGSSSATSISNKLVKMTLTFTGLGLAGEECHSLGDAAGVILVIGELHVVRLKSGSAGSWFLWPSTHIICKFEAIDIVIKGNVLSILTPILTSTKNFSIALNVVAGAQEVTQWENAAGEKVTAKLEGSISGGAFKAATIESAENKLTSSLMTEIVKTT
jgi:hypothetical protein